MLFKRAAGAVLAATASSAWAATAIPFRPEAAEGPSSGQWGWAILVCAVVLGVLVVLAKQGRLRRFVGAPVVSATSPNGIRVVESVRLTPQVRLVSVEFADQVLLLAVANTTVTVVGTKDRPAT